MGQKPQRPTGGTVYHAWRHLQDTRLLAADGSCLFYLERPVVAGRLDSNWNYKLQLGNKGEATSGVTLMTIRKQEAKLDGMTCQVINLLGSDNQILTSLHWLGDAKKLRTGKASGTKKYSFDWQGRELLWDSRTALAGTDHFCTDTGSGEVLCFFRSVFLPLEKDGKVEMSSRVTDETTRTMLMASCLAYREWADRRETGVYIQ